jgi:hypothetical protein
LKVFLLFGSDFSLLCFLFLSLILVASSCPHEDQLMAMMHSDSTTAL